MDGWIDGWIDGWLDGGWMDGCMDGWMDVRIGPIIMTSVYREKKHPYDCFTNL